jgi:DNA-binding transcriptional ArsR family regulator
MPTAFLPAIAVLRAAAEPTRLRLLALLSHGELTVGEICEIVAQSQPRISRHLKVLSDAGLLDRFREQHWVYYRAPSTGEGREIVKQLLALVSSDDDVLRRDRRKLEAVVAERARQASAGADVSQDLPAEVDRILVSELSAQPIGALLDVGTGSGHMLELLAGQATRAIGIDISSEALRLARTNVHSAGLSHCDLPFSTPLFDTAIADRVLGRAERPVAALAEITRTLKRGGRLIVIEDFDVLADVGESNPIAMLRAWFAQAGLVCDRIHPVDTEHGHLLLAIARRVSPATVAA